MLASTVCRLNAVFFDKGKALSGGGGRGSLSTVENENAHHRGIFSNQNAEIFSHFL